MFPRSLLRPPLPLPLSSPPLLWLLAVRSSPAPRAETNRTNSLKLTLDSYCGGAGGGSEACKTVCFIHVPIGSCSSSTHSFTRISALSFTHLGIHAMERFSERGWLEQHLEAGALGQCLSHFAVRFHGMNQVVLCDAMRAVVDQLKKTSRNRAGEASVCLRVTHDAQLDAEDTELAKSYALLRWWLVLLVACTEPTTTTTD